MSLKALADMTLERVTARDSVGTARKNTVPSAFEPWDTPRDTRKTVRSPSTPMPAHLPVIPVADEPVQLREWRQALSVIDHDRPPKRYPHDLWHQLHRDGIAFLDTWGAQAAALGWSTLDLFGVHRIAPAANYSAIGLVPLLRGAAVVAMTADTATIQRGTGARLTFRRHPYHPDAVPVWSLVNLFGEELSSKEE